MDVEVTRLVAASPAEVARIMFDPGRDREWIGGARSVDLPSGSPTAVGARVRRHGGFLGRRFSWVTEVVEHVPDALLRMRFVEGPMAGGEVSYRIAPDGTGSRVAIRNSGETGFAFPGMTWMVRRSVRRDLERLAALVES